MNQFDYNEPPEIQAAAQRVRAAAFGKYRPENWKEPEPAEPKPLRLKPSPTPGNGAHRLNRTEKLGIPKAKVKPQRNADLRRSSLTIRQILDFLKAGESFSEIARGAQISFSAVAQRINRCKDPEVKAEYAALLVCACGKSKNPSSKACYACMGKQRRTEAA